MNITSFSIKNLHNCLDVSVKIKGNRVVIVGVNGIGKTTFANIIYYFLTQQWKKIVKYDFDEIIVDTKEKKLVLTKNDIDEFNIIARNRMRSRSHFPASLIKRVENHHLYNKCISYGKYTNKDVSAIATDTGVHPQHIERILRDCIDSSEGLFPVSDGNVCKVEKYLRENLIGQVLYLPTYRRIEQDLKELFPELEEEIKKLNRRKSEAVSSTGFVELVQFGMEDVVDKINSVLDTIKESSRTELNNLAGSYLRDVIRNQAQTYDKKLITSLKEITLNRILSRVEEKTLSDEDKASMLAFINRMKSSNSVITEQDKYLAHFLSKLIEIYNKQKELEKPIVSLLTVCNKYLVGKSLRFDEINYRIYIKSEGSGLIEFSMLSSGEKQIVSLFSHLYLGESQYYYVVIDEPELSLSVEWQNMLLPDIWESGKCKFLLAVTHSPFIYENSFDAYTTEMKIIAG